MEYTDMPAFQSRLSGGGAPGSFDDQLRPGIQDQIVVALYVDCSPSGSSAQQDSDQCALAPAGDSADDRPRGSPNRSSLLRFGSPALCFDVALLVDFLHSFCSDYALELGVDRPAGPTLGHYAIEFPRPF